jgi:hypothetical protein
LASISAAGLIIASAGLGAIFAFGAGKEHGLLMAGLMTIFAVALELAKPIAVSSAFTAFRSWAIVRGLALSLLAAVAIAYSLTAELTLMATARGDLVAQRVADTKVAKSVDGRRERIEAELAKLANVRPAATIKADIAGIIADPRVGDCRVMYTKRARTECPRVNAFRAELGNAERREKLEADLASLQSAGPVAPAVREADPGSAALATYLASLGFDVPVSRLTDWLVLIPVLALEVGAALAGVLVHSVGGHRPSMSKGAPQPATMPEPRSAAVDSLVRESAPWTPALVKAAASAKSGAKRRCSLVGPERVSTRRLGNATVATKVDAQQAIVSTLQVNGGRMDGASVRGLAALIGAHKSNVHNAIAALIAAGTVARLGGGLVLQS